MGTSFLNSFRPPSRDSPFGSWDTPSRGTAGTSRCGNSKSPEGRRVYLGLGRPTALSERHLILERRRRPRGSFREATSSDRSFPSIKVAAFRRKNGVSTTVIGASAIYI